MSIIDGVLETFDELTKCAYKIMEDKNSSYRGGANILDSHANFKRIQKNYPDLEVDEIMNIMMDKHLDVIRQGSYGSIDELKERVCDCINYLVLIYDYKENEAGEEDKGLKEVYVPYQPKLTCEPCSTDNFKQEFSVGAMTTFDEAVKSLSEEYLRKKYNYTSIMDNMTNAFIYKQRITINGKQWEADPGTNIKDTDKWRMIDE